MQTNILNNKYRIIDISLVKGGQFGLIKKAQNLQTKQIVAIKQIKRSINDTGLNASLIREHSTLRTLGKHANIIQQLYCQSRLIDGFQIQDKLYFVFPYVTNNLRDLMTIQHKNNVPVGITQKVMKQLLLAVQQAHNSRIMHRDIKPQNILIQNMQNSMLLLLKVGDWGSSRKFNPNSDQKLTPGVIPLAYRPPELLFKTDKYTQTVDIWSVGCIFAEMIFGYRLFQSRSENIVLWNIVDVVGLKEDQDFLWIRNKYEQLMFEETIIELNNSRNNSLDTLFIKQFEKTSVQCDLLKKMLRINPSQRISAAQALKHSYFNITIS